MVLDDEVTDANLRWANNTLTTNGVTYRNQITVIAVVDGAVGVVSKSGVTLESLEALVRSAEHTAAQAPQAEDYGPLVAGGGPGPDWDAPPAETSIGVFRAVAAGAGRGVRPGRVGRRSAVRLRRARDAHHLSGVVGRPAGPPRSADRARRGERQVRRLRSFGLGRRGHRGLRRCRRGIVDRRPEPAPRLGGAPHRATTGPLRDHPSAERGRRPDDRPVLVGGRPRRPRRANRVQPARRRHPRRHPAHGCGRDLAQRPGRPLSPVLPVRDRP